MPVFQEGKFGNLFVEYTVVLPTEISQDMRNSENFILPLASSIETNIDLVIPGLTAAFHPHGHGKDEL